MAFNTKLNLSDGKVYQGDGQSLHLSGDTIIASVGTLSYETHPTITSGTQIVDKQYVDAVVVSGVTGGTVYNLDSPAAVTVGGITVGTVLVGKTSNEILSEILVPELFPVLTAPSESIALNPSTSIYEIGCSIATLCVTGTFNRGSINPQYCSASAFRSGAANSYCFTGAQISGSYACTTSPVTKCATSYVVSSGSQSWSVFTSYDAGVQPKGSKGTNCGSALPAGNTSTPTAAITGILPYYWGKKSVNNVISGSDVAAGTKVLSCANGTLPITYNSSASDYLWFAVPQGTPAKTAWFVCASNQGTIGGSNNLFASACSVAVTSAQGCWTACNFYVYVSCITTGTAAGVPMCMS